MQFRPNRFEVLPIVIKNLLIINALVYLAQLTFGKEFSLDDWFALHTWQSQLFKPWQLITHMFMHASNNPGHILGNMFALWVFGSTLENSWGSKRFLGFYLVCGLGAAFCHLAVLYFENEVMINAFKSITIGDTNAIQNFILKYLPVPQEIPYNYDIASQVLEVRLNEATIGASGAVFGCLAAYGYLFPNTYLYVYFMIPVKAKWVVIAYAAFELTQAISNSAGDNVAHVAHLGGALVGFLLVYFWNKNNRQTFY